MTLLGRILRWQSIGSAICGLALVVAPGTIAERLMAQPPTQAGWLRALGVAAIVLAAQMVLVARKLEELWWWSWSFVVLEAGVALAFAATALAGVPTGAPAWPWWTAAAISLGLAALDVAGLAKAGTERSPV